MNSAESFTFEGETVTAGELAKKLPAYKKHWLLAALRDGCENRAELARRESVMKMRHREAARENAKRKDVRPRQIGRGQGAR